MPFRDVAGHRRLIALLSRSIHNDTLPPSLIFAGADRAGARQTALAVAQAFNCLKPASPAPLDVDSCGRCPACSRIPRGLHPDVLIVEPSDNGSIKIDQVREVIDRAGYRPFEGRRRVVIIDEADALVDAAQNALLKTLEEPPPSSVFLLLTTRPDMLLATVQSRCPRLRFPAQADDEVDEEARDVAREVLAHVAANEAPGLRIEAAKALLVRTGSSDGARSTGSADREQLATHLRAMASVLRDVELLGVAADPRGLVHADVRSHLERLAPYRGERGLRAFETLDRALGALGHNAGVKIVADWVVLNL